MKHIDFHTHILPRADHGSDSVETSLKQIELSRTAGIEVIVATPHFYPHRHALDKFLSRRSLAAAEIKKHSDSNVIIGAEILLCDSLDKLTNLESLCIENTRTLLIELPFWDFRQEYITTVDKLIGDGYSVVLAHADRYPKDNIEKLVNLGAKIQLNASALSKFFVKRHLYEWIDRGLVVAIGSDIHMADKCAYKKFAKARKRLGEEFDKIMLESEKILFSK